MNDATKQMILDFLTRNSNATPHHLTEKQIKIYNALAIASVNRFVLLKNYNITNIDKNRIPGRSKVAKITDVLKKAEHTADEIEGGLKIFNKPSQKKISGLPKIYNFCTIFLQS